jgi:ABC-type nitrate/sulfonate/bicarbonate transport system permease component
VVLSAAAGFMEIKPVLLNVGRSFHASRWQMLAKVYMPAMINPLLAGLRLGMAMAIIGVLSAEISYSDSGLGFRLMQNANQFRIASVYALTILIFAVAAILNLAITKVQDRFNRHRASSRRARSETFRSRGGDAVER